jgi:hypothetical protein
MNIARFLKMSAHLQMMPVLRAAKKRWSAAVVMEGVRCAPHSYCVAAGNPRARSSPKSSRSSGCPKNILFEAVSARSRMLGQALTLGYRALKFSANAALDDGSVKEGQKPTELSSG